MADQPYDVAVIGGGIHGAGVAQAACAAGYRTLIVEQRHWAAGTSSRSSKLLHGGLRYLETAQLSLVRESLQERNRLLQLAPSLAHPLRFNIPIYRETTRRPWQLFFGLSIYALFSGLSPLSRFSWGKAGHNKLNPQGLQTVFSYWDGQTDDKLLTQAVIHSAHQLGADRLCPGTLVKADRHQQGYRLTINSGQNSNVTIDTGYVVNCTGPWVNELLSRVTPRAQPRACELVKGSHLVLKEKVSEEAYYLESPQDRRAIFLLPWGENSLLGTTEQRFSGDPQNVEVTREEREYLLSTARHYFPEQSFSIINEFAGLRVLPTGDSSAFSRPRECILHIDPNHPRLLSLYGGKLTTYRHTAEQVVSLMAETMGTKAPVADTRDLPLTLPQADT